MTDNAKKLTREPWGQMVKFAAMDAIAYIIMSPVTWFFALWIGLTLVYGNAGAMFIFAVVIAALISAINFKP